MLTNHSTGREPQVKSSSVTEALARLEDAMDEYRAAERRRILKQALALWKRSEAAHKAARGPAPPLTKKVH